MYYRNNSSRHSSKELWRFLVFPKSFFEVSPLHREPQQFFFQKKFDIILSFTIFSLPLHCYYEICIQLHIAYA